MSRSPKYSAVRTNEARRQQLERERAERERRRNAERARRAALALAKARTEANRELASVSDRCARLRNQPSAADTDLEPMTTVLDVARRAIEIASSSAEMTAALQKLRDVDRMRVATEAEVLRRSERNAARKLAALRRILDETDSAERVRFDPVRSQEVDRAVTALASALDRGDLRTFERDGDALLTKVREHRIEVSNQAALYAERRTEALVLSEEIAARITALVADAAAAEIVLEDLEIAGEVLERVQSDLAADRLDDARGLADRLMTRLDDVEQSLDSAIERITARREILGSIVDVLPRMGFAVDPRSVVRGSDGSIGLHANRMSGESLMVVVQEDAGEHRINYMREAGSGQPIEGRACTSLRELAEDLNSSVRREGFDTGPVTWDGDPTHPPVSGRRKVIPSQTDIARRRDRMT
ncbi:hypothetical protein [Actinocrispum wychmicini]|uniref:Uncharacterized protein n=1 Tax=Actinocrispum wychmicini TaxID=1213861 RepID=A0A4R2ITW1_9PSEU|nr:hypothetical protein [Actinocrispum wychmicini]TCO48022.1 hypothetical protein EV192_11675 [Actinocrispum wychmicini]